MHSSIIAEEAAEASTRVVEGALNLAKAEVQLAKAELQVAMAQAKITAQKGAIAGAFLWLSMCVAQVAITLICLLPMLMTIWDVPIVVAALALSIGLATTFGVIGGLRMRSAFASPKAAPRLDAPEPGVVGHAMHPRGI